MALGARLALACAKARASASDRASDLAQAHPLALVYGKVPVCGLAAAFERVRVSAMAPACVTVRAYAMALVCAMVWVSGSVPASGSARRLGAVEASRQRSVRLLDAVWVFRLAQLAWVVWAYALARRAAWVKPRARVPGA